MRGKHTKSVSQTPLTKHSRAETLTKDDILSNVKAVIDTLPMTATACSNIPVSNGTHSSRTATTNTDSNATQTHTVASCFLAYKINS